MHQPLAEKLRPQTLNDFVGQEHILGEGKILRRIIESDRIIPMIFWGPPGCGKTTLARIIANRTNSDFVFFSAVSGGVGEARKIIAAARERVEGTGKRTILFVDEIHRFNKSQQDFFLPYVENGTIILLGATTENPSFEVNAPLLSRARVFHFRELSPEQMITVIDQAIEKINANFSQFFPSPTKTVHPCPNPLPDTQGEEVLHAPLSECHLDPSRAHPLGGSREARDPTVLGTDGGLIVERILTSSTDSGFPQNDTNNETYQLTVSMNVKAKKILADLCEGDVRDAYNAIELAIISAEPSRGVITIDEKLIQESIQQKFVRYDKGADGHYDAISALHKSIRASQPDAALHYLARMLEAGEDPLYIVRRLVRCAAEDIGLADPQALILASATQQAVHFVGMPESNVIIAELVIYLSLAKKSRAVDNAYSAARADVLNGRLDPIPLKIRNAPTKLMKDFGFGKEYEMYTDESYLPDNLKDKKYWQN